MKYYCSLSYLILILFQIGEIQAQNNISGKIYDPDPITTSGRSHGYCDSNGCYEDNNGATNANLDNARVTRTLQGLTLENGKYKLKGFYCEIDDGLSGPVPSVPEFSNLSGFDFKRNEPAFEAVMAYYHVDKAGRYVESLGYWDSGLQGIKVDPHGGANGVGAYLNGNIYLKDNPWDADVPDSGEDAGVIWHEYAHAIQDHVGGLGPGGTAVKEGGADYWAASYTRSISSHEWGVVFSWRFGHLDPDDSDFIRRADIPWTDETDFTIGVGGVYREGQRLSSALMQIWEDLGRNRTDKLYLETHKRWGSNPDMKDFGRAFVEANEVLYSDQDREMIVNHLRNYSLYNDDKYAAAWTDLVNTTVTNTNASDIKKSSSSNSWNSGAASTNVIPGYQDGWVETTIAETNKERTIGLSYSNTGVSRSSIDFAINLTEDGEMEFRKNGNFIGTEVDYETGDIARVERIGSTIYFKKNGQTMETASCVRANDLIVDVSLYEGNATLKNVKFSHPAPAPGARVASSTVEDILGQVMEEQIVVYPNPSSNGTINLRLPEQSNFAIRVTDLVGRSVLSLESINESDLSFNLPSGVYIVVINSENSHHSKVEKIIVR